MPHKSIIVPKNVGTLEDSIRDTKSKTKTVKSVTFEDDQIESNLKDEKIEPPLEFDKYEDN